MKTVWSATGMGLQTHLVRVEISTTEGFPQLSLIGLASKSVTEAKERITTALLSLGFSLPKRKTVINLAPSTIQKQGSSLDLSIAVALLLFSQTIPSHSPKTLYFGEVSLDGSVRAIKGALPLVLKAQKEGFTKIVVPIGNMEELSLIKSKIIFPISHISQLTKVLSSRLKKYSALPTNTESSEPFNTHSFTKKELLVAVLSAAGLHNVYAYGPPGSGKSILAKSIPTLLPPLTHQESLVSTTIHSVAATSILHQSIVMPPVRSPHHTTTAISLVGGGSKLLPGEVSLAHNGVLLLDEAPEFSRTALESLRQPLENGWVSIARNSGTIKYPARFLLLLTANPCPCGYWQSFHKACRCTPHQRALYQNKLSGPLLDRVPLKIPIYDTTKELFAFSNKNVQKDLNDQVREARERQKHRFHNTTNPFNGIVDQSIFMKNISLTSSAKKMFNLHCEKSHCSHRAAIHLLRISQTLADIKKLNSISEDELKTVLAIDQSQ